MHETISDLREEYGASQEREEVNEGKVYLSSSLRPTASFYLRDHSLFSLCLLPDEDLGMVENLLQMISHTLSIVEVMSVFRGELVTKK